jgi:hypothetical protein
MYVHWGAGDAGRWAATRYFGEVIVKRSLFAIFGLALSMSLPVSSQTSQVPTAKFKGIVVDAYTARIPKASVLIEGVNRRWNLETDADGENVGEINVELPAGSYKFAVEARGFKRLVVEDFCVASGAAISYEFRMEVRGCDDCGGPPIAPNNPPPSH